MQQKGLATMMEATRLVREGKLAEATALLQQRSDHPRAGPHPAQAEQWFRAGALPHSGIFAGGLSGGVSMQDLLSRLPGGARVRSRATGAPAQAQLPGAWLEGSYANGAGQRDYRLYVPSGYSSGQPVPLITMLHGGTQTSEDFAAGTRMNELAERHTFLAVYPEQSATANPMRYWNWFQPAHQHRGAGEPSLIAGLTSHVISEYALETSRVYVAGFSAGAAMAAVMAACYPDVYAAAGVHSGLAYGVAKDVASAFKAMKQGAPANGRAGAGKVPLIVFHGDADPTVDDSNATGLVEARLRAVGGRYQAQTSREQVSGGRPYTRAVFNDNEGLPIVEQWTVHGGAHAWSGGSPLGSYTDPLGPDASTELVRFFQQHARAAILRQRRSEVERQRRPRRALAEAV